MLGFRYDEVMLQLPERLRDSTPYLLTQATKAAARLAHPVFAGERLRFAHYVTLAWLAETRVASQRELSDVMGVDPSDLVTVIDELVNAGVAERAVDPSDRRRRTLSITTAGEHWLHERDRRAQEYERLIRAQMPDGGVSLRTGLHAIITSAQQGS